MHGCDILILKGPDVQALLAGREIEIIQAARSAYETHARGESSLPHSTFLRFPDNQRDRIIALPAYLGGPFGIAGVKWVASFPGNLERELERASALVVLNSPDTGRPEAILEGSIISAKRTAGSAALAAQWLHNGKEPNPAGLIGCGLINFEISRFLMAATPEIDHFVVHDLDLARAEQFTARLRQAFGKVDVEIAKDVKTILRRCPLISLATTAITPHIGDLREASPDGTILHVSLRDLSPQIILSCDNVVDDIDHVCRARTSVHLAEQLTGGRDFIRCSLADILMGKAAARRDAESIAVFSPFGLGVLDLAVSRLVLNLALEQGRGTVIGSFLPEPWAGCTADF
jgi:2,3-diaminopropionate biosynthesis protein SbnB